MHIFVLLATKNGAPYLAEQLDSIKRQTVSVTVLASDDGSTDETRSILEDYKIEFVLGPCDGPAMNFFSLIQQAPVGDYYALSDQDDLWDSDKIEIAIGQLEKIQGPALYVGSARTQKGYTLTPRSNLYPEYILSNNAMGCTMVFNHDLLQAIREKSAGWSFALMHDWWIHLLASEVGLVVYDNEPHMMYRLHNTNHTGIPSWLTRLRNFFFALTHPGSKKNVIVQFRSIKNQITPSLVNSQDFQNFEKIIGKITSHWVGRLIFIWRYPISKKAHMNVLLKILIISGAFA
jgi:rhamnosyltransferase